MTDSPFAPELAATFAAEAAEYVAQLNRGLIELETGADEGRQQELLEELRRTAHTLKGSAGFTPHRDIVERAHEIENQLAAIAAGDERDRPFDGIYAHLDAVLRDLETDSAAPVAAADLVTEESVRVPTRKLDALMSLIGEILVTRVRGEERLAEVRALRERLGDLADLWRRGARSAEKRDRTDSSISDGLSESLHAVTTLWRELERDAMHMLILTDSLQNEIKRVRMQPIGVLFDGFRRTVRDLAARHDRQVRVVVEGESSEVDKKILEELRHPLLHLIRNAVDHGLEPVAERAAAGKPPIGTLTLRASTRASTIVVEVEDDGRGLDYEAIRRVAASRNLLTEAQTSDEELAEVVFLAGFSTRDDVGELSGRGVGLDAVREKVHRLEGEISVASSRGCGTKFTLTVPLTRSTSRGLLVRAGNDVWALPFSGIQRIVRVAPEAIVSIDRHEAVLIDARHVGLIRLGTVLGLPHARDAAAGDKIPIVVIARGRELLAVAVDALVGEQEMVVKPLGNHLRRVPYVAGAALLGGGAVVAVLNAADLFSARGIARAAESAPRREPAPARSRILVVDDSITTRTLEKSILETAGYGVRTARDGVEALELLEQEIDDAVISDVNMPRMDGIALVREMRRREALRDIPVVLVTSLGSEKDRRAGLESGANAYIVKTEFDQARFLDTLQSVIG